MCIYMKVISTIAAALLITAGLVSAQENASWLRQNEISPDGKTLAFSYKGDIYTVSSDGGTARQLTSNTAYDSEPKWTPDGNAIVFTSWREDSKDIYSIPKEGGLPKRLTSLPGNETPLVILPDGRIWFTWMDQDRIGGNYDGYPQSRAPQLFETNLEGKVPVLVTSMTFSAMSVNKNGTILYEDYKGYEDPLRKHHVSAVTRDLWTCVPADGRIDGNAVFTKVTTFAGEDRNPVFAADGNTFYFLSERDGKTSNVYRSSLSDPGKAVQLTFVEKDPVRFLSSSNDGTLAYSFNGALYTLREGAEPKKLDIKVFRDASEKETIRMDLRNASSMAVSPDGKEIALILRGDVYVTSVDYATTRRLTNTPEQERNVEFSSDGREIYFSAERNGCWGIWKIALTDKKDKLFTYAASFEESEVSTPGETCFQPDVSPDGKMVAYYRDRTELVVKNIKSGKEKSLFKNVNYSYSDGDQGFEWSPDSRYILCNWQENGGWNNEDIALIEVETGKITNLTESGYSDGNFQWALGGRAMVWESDKNGYRSHGSWGSEGDIYIMFFEGKAMNNFALSKEEEEIAKLLSGDDKKKDADKEKKDTASKKKPEKIELELGPRESRIRRLTPHSNMIGSFYLTPDGKKLYYTQRLERSYDLCVRDIQKGDIKVAKKGVYGGIVPSADGKYIFLFSGQGITRISTASEKADPVVFSGEFEHKPAAERAYIFEHCWKQVKEKFYREDLHGIDWNYYHDNYASFLPYIDNNFDFQDLLSEMLGELNGSHTGARYYPTSRRNLGYLGVIYDETWQGDGLKIREVLPGGVLNNADAEIAAGDVITAIEGHEIKAGDNAYALLSERAGKQTLLKIKTGKKDKTLFVKPSRSDADLLYKRWVRIREEKVKELSGGRVGYVHIEGMDSPSFRELYSKALGKYRTCEALIVDTRHNGGGWLHDDLVTFLGGKEYCLFTPRGQYIGHEPFNKWTKPSCVLIGEDNYSDACGFPFAYRALGIGKLIGAPVPGTMTAVWWERQVDPTLVFGIPQVGNWSVKDGRYIENFQVEPDIEVYNDPASVLRGEDRQLEAAVAEMLKQLDNAQ